MKYTAIAAITLPAGAVLALTKDQAASRKHVLQPHGKGAFITLAPVQFKAGEVFEYEGDLPKSLADLAEPSRRAAKIVKSEEGYIDPPASGKVDLAPPAADQE